MMKPLIWKEWHELRWKMAFSCLIIGAFVVIGLKSRILPDIGINILSVGSSALLIPIFIAMGFIAEEKNDKSLYTLFVLPIRIRLIYIIKMILGAGVVLSPILVSLTLSLLMAGGREESVSYVVKLHVMGACFAIVLFIVTVISGMKYSSEAKVALVGIAWIAFWSFCVFLEEMFILFEGDGWSMKITPWGFFDYIDGGTSSDVLIFHLLFCIAFFLWGIRRFNRLAGRQR